MAEKSRDKGGLIFGLSILAFIAGTNAIVYMVTGKILTSTGVGYSCAAALVGGIAGAIVAGAAGKVAPATKNAGARWLAPVATFALAAAFTGFLVIPTLRRSGDSHGYRGTYQVTYSDGHTGSVEGSELNHQEWSKWMGAYLGLASGLILAGLLQLFERVRKPASPGPEANRPA